MEVQLNRYPKGKRKALTMSYDDGVQQDKRLIEIFNKYGIKGTFHINGGLCPENPGERRISLSELGHVYSNHEISLH